MRKGDLCAVRRAGWLGALVCAVAMLAGAGKGALAAPATLSLVDPYLVPIHSDGSISTSTAYLAAGVGKTAALGLAADGSSAAIAVYRGSQAATVTFSASNGGRVHAYGTYFLTSATAGAASVAVPTIHYGGYYYALALVSASSAPTTAPGSPIVVAAKAVTTAKPSATATVTASVAAIPTPVVLIHGLWGDKSSLAPAQSYLEKINATYKANPFLTTAICYSIYLNFDAATDTLPGAGTGCEVTSAQAVTNYLTKTLYPQLDAKHWVGGRVDAVVHSMGGLVVRHYAATAGYKGLRNRYLGVFHDVVTLDTPETGSSLATFLDAHQNATHVGTGLIPSLLWSASCGTKAGTTLGQCFYATGQPLAYAGQPLSSGAVASLIPGSAHFASGALPAPGVFNTSWGKWFTVASDFKATDTPPSLLRDVLNNLIAATETSTTPDTVDSILASADNDVIVTEASQTSTAVGARTVLYKDLQHTAAPAEAELLFSSDVNNAVDDSAKANAQVAYWLGLQKNIAPLVRTAAPGAAASEEPAAKARFVSSGRVRADEPEGPVELGRAVTIPLTLNAGRIARVVVVERDANGRELRNSSQGLAAGSGAKPELEALGGLETVRLTPVAAGRLNLELHVVFTDGGFETLRLPLAVRAGTEGLERLELNQGFDRLALVAGSGQASQSAQSSQAQLHPSLRYSSLDRPIYLDSLEQFSVTVRQPAADPVVQVEANGQIHALRPGHAIIEARLGQARSRVVVDVYAPDVAPAGYAAAEE